MISLLAKHKFTENGAEHFYKSITNVFFDNFTFCKPYSIAIHLEPLNRAKDDNNLQYI